MIICLNLLVVVSPSLIQLRSEQIIDPFFLLSVKRKPDVGPVLIKTKRPYIRSRLSEVSNYDPIPLSPSTSSSSSDSEFFPTQIFKNNNIGTTSKKDGEETVAVESDTKLIHSETEKDVIETDEIEEDEIENCDSTSDEEESDSGPPRKRCRQASEDSSPEIQVKEESQDDSLTPFTSQVPCPSLFFSFFRTNIGFDSHDINTPTVSYSDTSKKDSSSSGTIIEISSFEILGEKLYNISHGGSSSLTRILLRRSTSTERLNGDNE